MTVKEIIKFLEWHSNDKNGCDLCPYNSSVKCCKKLSKECLDIIKDQKASLNAVRDLMVQLAVQIKTAKVEAIKEFAKRLKEEMWYEGDYVIIDRVVEEMVGDER